MRVFLAATLTLLFVSNGYAVTSGVDLAHLSGWNIVVAEDAIPSEQYAAQELQTFLEKATGTNLQITNAVSAKASSHHFYVGNSAPADDVIPNLKTEMFGPEDFRIVIGDNAIVIMRWSAARDAVWRLYVSRGLCRHAIPHGRTHLRAQSRRLADHWTG